MSKKLRITRAAKRVAWSGPTGLLLTVFLIVAGHARGACTAAFTYSVSVGTVTFTNTTSGASSAADYSWNFGDGTGSASKNPTHTYDQSGAFVVTLTVRDSAVGCWDYYQDSVKITGVCKAAFTTNASFNNVNFFASNSGPNATYAWKFGDGNSSSASANGYVSHTYATGGTYTVCLTTVSSVCSDSICKQITVSGPNPCDADFSWSLGSNGQVTFTNSSTAPSGGITSYYWDFGDGHYGNTKNPVHTYASSGGYWATLYMSDSNSTGNCSDHFSDSVKVYGACNASFSLDNSNGLDVNFYGTYYLNSYEWNFGDGGTSNTRYASHTYASAGNYTVCFKVYGDSGCVDSVCKSVTVSAKAKGILRGFVYLEDTTALPDTGVAYLIYYNPMDSALTAIDTIMFSSDTSRYASFTFTGVKNGYYLVKAALTKTSAFWKKYLPTYADTARKWKDARMIYVSGTAYATITLQKGKNKGGKGFIGGKVTQGANKKEGDPLEDIEVMLTDKTTNEPAAYTYTDINGEFSFTDLALSTYEVYTEVIGLATEPGIVTLTEETNTVNNIQVRVNSSGVTTSIAFKGGNIFVSQPKLFPNPVTHMLYLSMEIKTACRGTLSVIDYSGKILYSRGVSLSQGKQTLELNTEKWPAGLYLLRLDAPGGAQAQYRFIKM
jgi:PKD repeat protein